MKISNIHIIKFIFLVIFSGCNNSTSEKTSVKDCTKQIVKQINLDSIYNYTKNGLFEKELVKAAIIGLGESTHGDGETFRCKIKFIKAFCSESKRRVIAFESSMLDVAVYKIIAEKNYSADSFFAKNLFPIWGKSNQLIELTEYCKLNKEINLVGFDLQFSPQISGNERITAICKFLSKYCKQIDTSQYKILWELMKIADFRRHKYWLSNNNLQDSVYKVASSLSREIEYVKPTSAVDLIIKRGIQQIDQAYYFLFNIIKPFPSEEVILLRDRIMAQNVKFLFDSVYHQTPMILWGANSHLMFNRDKLEHKDRMIPMGTYLKKLFSDKYYCISFTAEEGAVNSLQSGVIELPKASPESIEAYIASGNKNYAMLSMAEFRKQECYENFVSRMLGYQDMDGKWAEMTDAIFWIRKQLPNKMK